MNRRARDCGREMMYIHSSRSDGGNDGGGWVDGVGDGGREEEDNCRWANFADDICRAAVEGLPDIEL